MDTITLNSLIPYLRVKDAAAAIDFYAKAFSARELVHITDPVGLIAHAELELGGLRLKLADEMHDQLLLGPQSSFTNPVVLDLIVNKVDAQLELPMDMLLGYTTLKRANWLFDFPNERWVITRPLPLT